MRRSGRRAAKRTVEPRDALMDAVVRLTAKGGIESVSVRTVVAEAEGVGTDVYLYRLFGGKETLLSEAFLRADRRLAQETERRTTVLWEDGLPFESRLRYLWNTVWHWLADGHAGECAFLTRYYYCSFCGKDTLSAHRTIWAPTAEKWREIFPHTDTIRLAEGFFSTALTAAFPVCIGRIPNDGMAEENGFRTLCGLFAFWTENAVPASAERLAIERNS